MSRWKMRKISEILVSSCNNNPVNPIEIFHCSEFRVGWSINFKRELERREEIVCTFAYIIWAKYWRFLSTSRKYLKNRRLPLNAAVNVYFFIFLRLVDISLWWKIFMSLFRFYSLIDGSWRDTSCKVLKMSSAIQYFFLNRHQNHSNFKHGVMLMGRKRQNFPAFFTFYFLH